MLCAGETESAVVSQIAQTYRIDQQRVQTDLRSLLSRLSQLQLSPGAPAEAATKLKDLAQKQLSYPWYGSPEGDKPQPRMRMVVAAFMGLAFFDLTLRFRSLNSLCSWVNAWPVRERSSGDQETQARVCTAVERACVWYPKQAKCLQRSAVTTCILKSYGLPAQMVIGVRPVPFMAHAWVEVNGSVLNDWRGVTSFYRPLVSY